MKKKNMFIRFLLLITLIVSIAACDTSSKKETAGEYVDDSVITTKVKALLGADAFLNSFEINVETAKGTVQLSGLVDSQNAIDKAGEIAKTVQGVKSVKNNLNIKK